MTYQLDTPDTVLSSKTRSYDSSSELESNNQNDTDEKHGDRSTKKARWTLPDRSQSNDKKLLAERGYTTFIDGGNLVWKIQSQKQSPPILLAAIEFASFNMWQNVDVDEYRDALVSETGLHIVIQVGDLIFPAEYDIGYHGERVTLNMFMTSVTAFLEKDRDHFETFLSSEICKKLDVFTLIYRNMTFSIDNPLGDYDTRHFINDFMIVRFDLEAGPDHQSAVLKTLTEIVFDPDQINKDRSHST